MTCNFHKYSASGNTFLIINLKEMDLSVDFQPGQGGARDVDGIVFYTILSKDTCRLYIIDSEGVVSCVCGNGLLSLLRHLADTTGQMSWNLILSGYEFKGFIEEETINLDVTPIVPAPIAIEECQVTVGKKSYQCYKTFAGIPHLLIFTDSLDNQNAFIEGKALRFHERFAPNGTNVNFAEVQNSSSIRLHTYERSIEKVTGACGTGAVAAFSVAFHLGYIDSNVEIIPLSGKSFTVGQYGDLGQIFLKGYVERLSTEAILQESNRCYYGE